MKKFSISILVIFVLTNIFILHQSRTLAAETETNGIEQEETSIVEVDLTTQEVKTIKDVISNFSATELDTKEPYTPKIICSPQSIFGKDDRIPVPNSKILPYSAIGKIEIRYTNDYPALHGGTAFLVSKRVALTAGHCIYDGKLGYANL